MKQNVLPIGATLDTNPIRIVHVQVLAHPNAMRLRFSEAPAQATCTDHLYMGSLVI